MQPTYLPNHQSIWGVLTDTDHPGTQSKAEALSAKIKNRVAELEIIIAKTRKRIQARKRHPAILS
jgi:hypothetical protein